jgi:N4-gp56 family major capsid protein
MAFGSVNTSSQYAGAIARKIDRTALPVAQRYLVLSQFADKKTIGAGVGVTWTADRWNRLPLSQSPIAEGVPPPPQQLTFTQVTGIATQWGGRIVFTDIAVHVVPEDLLQRGSERLGMQLAETKERNGWNSLNAVTQVNYVAQAGSRAALVAGNNLDPTTVTRTYTNLKVIGAPLWNGQTGETIDRSINYTADQGEKAPRSAEHLVAITNPLCLQDLKNNPLVVQTYQYSDHTKLYTNENGTWGGMVFCESNIMPSWTGVAQVNGANAAGSLSTATYTIQVTGFDNQNFYESRIYQVSADVSVTTGGISLTTPSTPGFTYAVYVGVGSGAAPMNLGLTTSGPTSGPYAGQAIGIAPSTAVTITGLGLFQVPPAAPATGVTVYRTYVFGKEAFATLKLMNVQWFRLSDADKSDPLNQLRLIGYKYMEGWVILNQNFLAAIESTASSNGSFT